MRVEYDRGGFRIEAGGAPDEHRADRGEVTVVLYGALRRGTGPENVGRLADGFSREALEEITAGGYVAVRIDRGDGTVRLLRDPSGQKTVYYSDGGGRLVVDTDLHAAAAAVGTDFDKLWTDFLLFQEFVPDGRTIYSGVKEAVCGADLTFGMLTGERRSAREPLPILFQENGLSAEENVRRLREEIIDVHDRYRGRENIVYLSGGIDSCTILAALCALDPKSVSAVTFRVKGTSQDETVYAQEAARHFGVPCRTVEVDPADRTMTGCFEERAMAAANPYIGDWYVRPPHDMGTAPGARFFTGQDTRLHTPSVDRFDKAVIRRIASRGTSRGSRPGRRVAECYSSVYGALGMDRSRIGLLRKSDMAVAMLDPQEYLLKRRFMADRLRYRRAGYDETNLEAIRGCYDIDFGGRPVSEREVYNRIVACKWGEQYTDDIKYMTDLGRSMGRTVLLPFYDGKLSRFASSIPWKVATATMDGVEGYSAARKKVNKYVLRMAFAGELPHELLMRSKAVSVSNHLLLGGVLGEDVRREIAADLASPESFCRRFGYEELARRVLSVGVWRPGDYRLTLRAVYLAALCVYNRRVVAR